MTSQLSLPELKKHGLFKETKVGAWHYFKLFASEPDSFGASSFRADRRAARAPQPLLVFRSAASRIQLCSVKSFLAAQPSSARLPSF